MHVAPTVEPSRDTAAVFVHGLFSSPEVWNPLIALLEKDRSISQSIRFERFQYSSPKFVVKPTSRIPTIEDAASKLGVWLQENQGVEASSRIALIGHSQGGLVIQKYLASQFEEGNLAQIRKIGAVVLLATPNTGSELLISLRRWLGVVWRHAQEQQLRPYDEAIEKMRRTVLHRAVLANPSNGNGHPIRFFVFAGENDNVVNPRSAKWMYPNAGTLPGDHFTILQPADASDDRYKVVRSALRWVRHWHASDRLSIETEALDLSRSVDVEAAIELGTGQFLPRHAPHKDDLKHWLNNQQENWSLRLSFLVPKVNGQVVGFAMFHQSKDLILVDYITVKLSPEQEHLSQVVMKHMVDRLTRIAQHLGGARIVFEVDPSGIAGGGEARRQGTLIRYFQTFGARVISGVKYVAPDMDTMQAGKETPCVLMYARPGAQPDSLSGDDVKAIVRRIYRVWYRNWFSHRGNATELETYLVALSTKTETTVAEHCPLVTWIDKNS